MTTETTLRIENYRHGLGSFLDEKNIKWEEEKGNEGIIKIFLVHPENFSLNEYLFELGFEFGKFYSDERNF